jgi:hypothetical protein
LRAKAEQAEQEEQGLNLGSLASVRIPKKAQAQRCSAKQQLRRHKAAQPSSRAPHNMHRALALDLEHPGKAHNPHFPPLEEEEHLYLELLLNHPSSTRMRSSLPLLVLLEPFQALRRPVLLPPQPLLLESQVQVVQRIQSSASKIQC